MSARSDALSMSDADVAERARKAAETREAQAQLDALEPGSDQATKLLESAARKGLKLRVRHTLVDRTAIDALAEGLARDYELHAAEIASTRRKKLLAVVGTLALASAVAATVVLLSRSWLSPPTSSGAAMMNTIAREPPLGTTRPAPPDPRPEAARDVTPTRATELARPQAAPAQCTDAHARAVVSAEPLPPEPTAQPVAPVKQIEPYFGTR